MEIINDMPANCAMEAPDNRTWWQKRIDRLFPWKHCPLPEAPAEWKDCVTVRTVTKLEFVDWLRVIITGVVCVDVRTVTENEVGGTRTECVCFIGTKRDVRGER